MTFIFYQLSLKHYRNAFLSFQLHYVYNWEIKAEVTRKHRPLGNLKSYKTKLSNFSGYWSQAAKQFITNKNLQMNQHHSYEHISDVWIFSGTSLLTMATWSSIILLILWVLQSCLKTLHMYNFFFIENMSFITKNANSVSNNHILKESFNSSSSEVSLQCKHLYSWFTEHYNTDWISKFYKSENECCD